MQFDCFNTLNMQLNCFRVENVRQAPFLCGETLSILNLKTANSRKNIAKALGGGNCGQRAAGALLPFYATRRGIAGIPRCIAGIPGHRIRGTIAYDIVSISDHAPGNCSHPDQPPSGHQDALRESDRPPPEPCPGRGEPSGYNNAIPGGPDKAHHTPTRVDGART